MEGIKFMQNLLEKTDINVSTIGQIIDCNMDNMTATVKPLIGDLPLLINVPIAHLKTANFTITTPYEEGDIVVILFADNDIDNVLISGQKTNVNSTRVHDLSDGIIIGSIHTFNNTHFDLSNDALNIMGENNHIKMFKNGDIDIVGKTINIKGDRINLN